MSEIRTKAQELYQKIRTQVETDENLGKIIVFEVDSGDYEMDEGGIVTAHRLRERHPQGRLFALRIGYKTVESFGGLGERAA
jgi:hypothetical protein